MSNQLKVFTDSELAFLASQISWGVGPGPLRMGARDITSGTSEAA